MSVATEGKKILEDALKEEKPLQFIETGNVGLDLALTDGKGLPMGSSLLLWATPGIGKTTVIGDLCRRLISTYSKKDKPFKVLYLDVEGGGVQLFTSLGLDEFQKSKDFIPVTKTLRWRQIGEMYDCILDKEPIWEDVKVVVIDSVNSVLSDQDLKSSVADGDFGSRARERSRFYSRYLPACKEQGVTSIFISQARQKQGASQFEDPNKAAVSNTDLHYVDVILKCTAKNNQTDASKIEEKTIFGNDKVAYKYILTMDSKATSCKNRFIKGNAVEILIERGVKVHNYYTVRKMLEGNKFIQASGSYYSFSKDICDSLGIPEKKMRLATINDIVEKHLGDFISLLKKTGKYKVGLSEKEIPVSKEEESEEEE